LRATTHIVVLCHLPFLLNSTSTTTLYPLPLHDALPICARRATPPPNNAAVGTRTRPPTPAIGSRRGKRPSATAPRNLGSGYRANGASTRTAESGMGERITIAVVQNGAR